MHFAFEMNSNINVRNIKKIILRTSFIQGLLILVICL